MGKWTDSAMATERPHHYIHVSISPAQGRGWAQGGGLVWGWGDRRPLQVQPVPAPPQTVPSRLQHTQPQP